MPEKDKRAADRYRALESNERAKQERKDLSEVLEPGSWRCSRCDSIADPDAIECPGYVHGTQKFCQGSQIETWGGYVRTSDKRPPVSRRETDPDWRGRCSGGSRSLGAKAKGKLTAAEKSGDLSGLGTARKKEVEETIAARRRVKDARDGKTARRKDRKRQSVMSDPP